MANDHELQTGAPAGVASDVAAAADEQEADVYSEDVPVSFRHQKKDNGKTTLYYVKEHYQLLSAFYSWELFRQNFIIHLKKQNILVEGKPPPAPALSYFSTVFNEECPTIRTRSLCKNVCDECVIYANKLGTHLSATETEQIADHVKEATALRFVGVLLVACGLLSVIWCRQRALRERLQGRGGHRHRHHDDRLCGFPHSEKTPPKSYFVSLMSAFIFDARSFKAGEQPNYVYTDRRGATGANEVVSLLETYGESAGVFTRVPGWGKRKGVVYADICGGGAIQEQHGRQVHSVPGAEQQRREHQTSLSRERPHEEPLRSRLRRKYARSNLWTLGQLCETVDASSAMNACVNLEDNDGVFRDFKTSLNDLYKNMNALQSYQLLTMSRSDPGAVVNQETPESAGNRQALLRGTTATMIFSVLEVAQFWSMAIAPLSSPKLNSEKVVDIYNKVLPFVPVEF
ncbi:hypothetical protein PybrP1_012318 [[Pythium] brassicae (nom. inval.)]|nr:hypothetical protein PybrP1_012318 [[Pythium] brassicae (nom. inval.)]